MHIKILGVCGTFMAGIALLAKNLGHQVEGYDEAFYEPMNSQLKNAEIILHNGYNTAQAQADLFIIGNAIKRGNPMMEWILETKASYISGPEWLYKEVLSKNKKVLAVSGTHGKTTTSSMLAWVLSANGKNPGFLIGGIPQNFNVSAALGNGDYFVIEADEYDTAFFDKRSKFVHYHPDILIINNLEFDHADIFEDLPAIQKQFHHLIRTMPQSGIIIHPQDCPNIDAVLEKGVWSHTQTFSLIPNTQADWTATLNTPFDGSIFSVNDTEIQWHLIGEHNVSNALTVIAAACAIGISETQTAQALKTFQNVKRRLEIKGYARGVTVYDDFAHHPTAIEATLNALKSHVKKESITAVLHLASNSMKLGIYNHMMEHALEHADRVIVLDPKNENALAWTKHLQNPKKLLIADSVDTIIETIVQNTKNHSNNEHILIMSNGFFQNIHEKLLEQLSQ